MIKNSVRKILLTAGIAAAAILFLFGNIQGASALSSGGIGIRPAQPAEGTRENTDDFVYNEVEPGEEILDGVTLTNQNDEPVTIELQAIDATTTNSGNIGFVPKESENEEVGTWIEFDQKEITLPPNSSQVATFAIQVPETADVGDHIGGIAILDSNPSGERAEIAPGSQVNIVSRVVNTVYLTVPGETIRDVVLLDKTYSQKADGTLEFKLKFKNRGNVRANLEGTTTIHSPFGEVTSFESNFGQVLREEERISTINYDPDSTLFGLYWADFQVGYEKAPEPIETRIWMLIVPWDLLGYGLAGVLILWLIYQFYIWRRLVGISNLKVIEYEAKLGDTLRKIGAEFGTSWELIAHLNDLDPPYHIDEGDILYVPDPEGSVKAQTPSYLSTALSPVGTLWGKITGSFKSDEQGSKQKKPEPGKTKEKQVSDKKKELTLEENQIIAVAEAGDTLGDVAEWANTTQKHIAELNGIEYPYKYEVQVGEEFIVPEPEREETKPKVTGKKLTTVIVEKGDTLQDVANFAGTSVKEIAQLNRMKETYEPEEGEELVIPEIEE